MNLFKNCTLNGWLVNELDVQTQININIKLNEEIELVSWAESFCRGLDIGVTEIAAIKSDRILYYTEMSAYSV